MNMTQTKTGSVVTKIELANPGSKGKSEHASGYKAGCVKASRKPGKSYNEGERMAGMSGNGHSGSGPRIR